MDLEKFITKKMLDDKKQQSSKSSIINYAQLPKAAHLLC